MWQRSLARVSSQLCAISTRSQSETNKKDSFASKPGGRVETLENPRLGYKFVFVSLLSVPDIVLLFVMGSNNRLGEKIGGPVCPDSYCVNYKILGQAM